MVGSTKGGAKDAPLVVKAQAIILYYKKIAMSFPKVVPKMEAYEWAAQKTNNSIASVRGFVAAEMTYGMHGLESRREHCGAVTRYSPSKKSKINALMEETKGEASLLDVQAELGLGSAMTARSYIEKADWVKATKRLKTLLSPAHMRYREQTSRTQA